MYKNQLWNVPNMLCLLRIAMIPAIVIRYLTAQSFGGYIVTGVLILLSGLTDAIDGYVARKYNMVTDLGKVLDPFADKLTQVSLAIMLAIRMPMFRLLLLVFILKEVIMIGAGLFLYNKKIKMNSSRWFGKVATVVFYASMVLVILIPPQYSTAHFVILSISACFMIFSFVMYIPEFFRLKKPGQNQN